MDKKQAIKRIESLKETLEKFSYQYYVLNASNMSDEEFDALKRELQSLEEQFPDLITEDSPTQRVGGAPIDSFQKVEHSRAMLSIDDIFEKSELEDWEVFLKKSISEDFTYFCEGKIDGLALALRYKNGSLDKAITRGNGTQGEDVTHNAKTVKSIPIVLRAWNNKVKDINVFLKNDIEIRGEIYITYKNFERINKLRKKQDEPLFANPRNLAAGSVRQLDPSLVADRALSFRAYDILCDNYTFQKHSDKHIALNCLGFPTDSEAKEMKTIDRVYEYWKDIEKKREKIQTPIDGIVVRVNNYGLFERLGTTGKSPRGIRALKFEPKTATTKIKSIVTQVGRTGVLTPVAELEPVLLSGVMISRATLHNEEEIQRLDARIGDTVVIERAGDVIPSVVKIVHELRNKNSKQFLMPRKCPVCGTSVERRGGEVAVRCPNKKCSSQLIQGIIYFTSRSNFNIDGLGDKIVRQLVKEGLIKDVADIFTLNKERIESLERFSDKSASNLIEAIESSKKISFARFISALNIPHIGAETAQELAKNFKGIADLQKAKKEDLEKIYGIGAEMAESLVDWFGTKSNNNLIARLIASGVIIENKVKKSGPLAGRQIVFTGTLDSMDRESAREAVIKSGGMVSSSVSSKVDFVVYGEGGGSKRGRAESLGIPLINEKEFIKMIQ